MLCAGLVQPLWLGFLNANGVIVGYNKLVTLLEKSSLREERIKNYASSLIEVLKAKFPKVEQNITGTNIPVRPLTDFEIMEHPYVKEFSKYKDKNDKEWISKNSFTKENTNKWRILMETYGQEALSKKISSTRRNEFKVYIEDYNIEDINEDIKVGGGEPPKKNDNDYCQIMYPAYEGKVVMDQLESIEKNQDKEIWKTYIRTKKASFYAAGIESEEDNMKLAYNIIHETILYCKDKEGIETKLHKGEYKYDLFIELLTSIFELSSIISLGDGGETKEQERLNKIIKNPNATEFANFWNSLDLEVQNSALSSSSFFNNWVKYFNKNIDKKAYRRDNLYIKKKIPIQDWATAIKTTSEIEVYNVNSWVALFLGYNNEKYKKNAIRDVFNIISSESEQAYKLTKWESFVREASEIYGKGDNKGKVDFIKYLINKKVIKKKLIKKWAEDLKKVVDVEAQNTIYPEAVSKTREFMKTFITLAMESWYINQNISGILKKCSEVSGILPDVIEDNIVQYRKDYTINSEDDKSIVDEFLKGVTRRSKPNLKGDTTGSMKGNITKIDEYISKSRTTNPLKITNEFIKYCQDTYKPDALFPVVTFPKDLAKSNKEAYDFFKKKISEDSSEVNRKTNLKNWAKKKTDTVVGVLMQPYFDKGVTLKEEFNEQPNEIKREISSIEDFKMFYVIQNNKTKLKCYDQLKVFSKFSNFIKQVIK